MSHCWKSHALAHISIFLLNPGTLRSEQFPMLADVVIKVYGFAYVVNSLVTLTESHFHLPIDLQMSLIGCQSFLAIVIENKWSTYLEYYLWVVTVHAQNVLYLEIPLF